jgi:transposase
VDLCGRETLTNWGNIRASTNPGAVQMPQDPDVERLVFGVRHEGLPLVRLTSLSWGWSPREGCSDAQEVPVEFKRDVVRVARRGDLTVAEVAADFDVSPESVRRWVRQADIDDGVRDGLTTAEQSELVQLRRDKRRLEMENEVLRRAAAYLAKDSLPK